MTVTSPTTASATTSRLHDKLKKLLEELTPEQRKKVYDIWSLRHPVGDPLTQLTNKQLQDTVGLCERTMADNAKKADEKVLQHLAELRRDAERYRWIKAMHQDERGTCGVWVNKSLPGTGSNLPVLLNHWPSVHVDGCNLDEAVDKAMAVTTFRKEVTAP